MGVGAARGASAVGCKLAQEIIIAWIITMPAAALIAAAGLPASSGEGGGMIEDG